MGGGSSMDGNAVAVCLLPSDSVNIIIKEYEAETGKAEVPSHSENIVREYFCIRTFLDAQDSFTDWFDHYHQKRPTAPKKCSQNATFAQQVAYEQAEQQYKGEMERWKQTLNLITTWWHRLITSSIVIVAHIPNQTACDRLYNVLLFPDGGWLVDTNLEEQEQDPAGTSAQEGSAEGQAETAEPNRSHHLSVLRSIYIPQVASLLQNILHATEKYKECLQLADLIASEQYQLYKIWLFSHLLSVSESEGTFF
ncbi:Nuclear pore complex protein Nup107 [Portunus trituberculatus]|uniref:Nuclear pore complex protein n=1 Tax=Portunus trituberculatus TaxID=210409 RepID=A0A5B7EJK7_PORTR|nr:Nuclear pore complex protein Nup107 [Portunus trituberculatus]